MKPALEQASREMRAVLEETRGFLEGLSDERFAKPGPGGGWSAGQCLEHLTITAWTMNELIDQGIGEAHARGLKSSDDYRPHFLWRWFLKQIDAPPSGKKSRPFQTPDRFDPAPRDPSDVVPDFFASHAAFLEKFAAADAVDLKRVKVKSPFAKRLKYPLGLVFLILPAHCRRHLAQARRAAAE